MNWLKEVFFYDVDTFTWAEFVVDACVAFGLLLLMVVGMWVAYAYFG